MSPRLSPNQLLTRLTGRPPKQTARQTPPKRRHSRCPRRERRNLQSSSDSPLRPSRERHKVSLRLDTPRHEMFLAQPPPASPPSPSPTLGAQRSAPPSQSTAETASLELGSNLLRMPPHSRAPRPVTTPNLAFPSQTEICRGSPANRPLSENTRPIGSRSTCSPPKRPAPHHPKVLVRCTLRSKTLPASRLHLQPQSAHTRSSVSARRLR